MEAMDLLLVACHAQTLNLFVESFLRMVQKLLEDSNATLQILATNSVSVLLRFIYTHFNENGRSLHGGIFDRKLKGAELELFKLAVFSITFAYLSW